MHSFTAKTISILLIFALTTGGLNVFNSGWLLLSFLGAYLLLLIHLFYEPRFNICDFLFLLFFLVLLFSSIVNPNTKSINYLFAWFAAFYLFLYRSPVAVAQSLDAEDIIFWVGVSALFVALFSIFEQFVFFTLGYIVFFDLPRFDYDHSNYMGVFYRSYALFNEPSNLANFLLLTSPFAILSLGKKWIPVLLAGLFFSFSASGFALGITGLFVFQILHAFSARGGRLALHSIIFIIFALSIPYVLSTVDLFGKLLAKLTLANSDLSSSLRFSRLIESFQLFLTHPVFGAGPGYWSVEKGVSPNNLYLLVLSESGALGFVFFIAFLVALTSRAIVRTSSYFRPLLGYMLVVGLGFGFFTGVMFSLLGVFFIVLVSEARLFTQVCGDGRKPWAGVTKSW